MKKVRGFLRGQEGQSMRGNLGIINYLYIANYPSIANYLTTRYFVFFAISAMERFHQPLSTSTAMSIRRNVKSPQCLFTAMSTHRNVNSPQRQLTAKTNDKLPSSHLGLSLAARTGQSLVPQPFAGWGIVFTCGDNRAGEYECMGSLGRIISVTAKPHSISLSNTVQWSSGGLTPRDQSRHT